MKNNYEPKLRYTIGKLIGPIMAAITIIGAIIIAGVEAGF